MNIAKRANRSVKMRTSCQIINKQTARVRAGRPTHVFSTSQCLLSSSPSVNSAQCDPSWADTGASLLPALWLVHRISARSRRRHWCHDQPKLVPSPQYTSITLRYTKFKFNFFVIIFSWSKLYHRGRETSSWFRAVTLVTLKIQMYPDGYRMCILRVTIGGYRITAW